MTYRPSDVNYQGPQISVDRDAEHLRILSICWYVLSGLAAVGGCLPVIHVSLGAIMLFSPSTFGAAKPGDPPLELMGGLFLVMGLLFMTIAWTGAILGFITARSLRQRKRLWICYVASAVACLQIPIGTVLGVFTFIVLARPGITASFKLNSVKQGNAL